MQRLNAGRTKTAFRCIDDSLKRQIIGRLRNQPQIGNGVTNLGSFIKPGTNHPVGQANGNEAFLKFACLEPGTHKHSNLRQIMSVSMHRLDIGRNRARFVRAIPIPVHPQLFTCVSRGIECLAKPAFIVRDNSRRSRQNMPGRPVILLQPNNGRARKITFELQNVANLGPAPAID